MEMKMEWFKGDLPEGTIVQVPQTNTLVGGQFTRIFFPNGFGASIAEGGIAYGGLEIAVLRGNTESSELTYNTSVTDDVLGYLTPDMVDPILRDIAALPSRVDAASQN
jgi:hypothetical protein